jgi:hypothetical protein
LTSSQQNAADVGSNRYLFWFRGGIAMNQYRTTVVRLVGFAIIASVAAVAIRIPASSQTPSPNSQQAQPVPYRPGMGDFMTAGVSPRFIKLAASRTSG